MERRGRDVIGCGTAGRAGAAAAAALAAILAVPAAALLAGCPGRAGDPAGGGRAPGNPAAVSQAPVSFADLDGLWTALRERHRAGRAVLVNFWATWCIPCVDELPDLERLSREFAGRGPDVVGVSLDGWITGNGAETEEKVKTFLARTGVTYANFVYTGDQDPLLSGFDLPGAIPHSILFDRDGRQAASWNGMIDPEELRRAIAALR